MSAAAPLRVDIRSDPTELQPVREHLRAWLGPNGWNEQQIAEIVLAVDEALTNVIRHGYGGRTDQPIHIECRPIRDAVEGPGVEVRIRDFGRQVDLSKIAGRRLEEVRPGGLGVHIIHAMTNSARYSHADGGGMLLVMVKYLTHTAKCDDGSRSGA
ncbi:serine-protein kinase RsbW [Phycisphaerae bacterium RAS1]|nr:serine-protein kinase RsbW [Phycisphaerae bacterium RAS1]